MMMATAVIIILFGFLGSYLAWNLGFWIADVFFHTVWVSWLFGLLGVAIMILCTLYVLFGPVTAKQERSSGTALWPLVVGFFIGSWWSKD